MVSTFELLPRELRDEIYEYCLCVKGDVVPFPAVYEDQCNILWGADPSDEWFQSESEENPSMALLLVNKRVGNEAAETLYGKNVWRLSLSGVIDEDGQLDTLSSDYFWESHAPLFRHIKTQCHMSDCNSPRTLMRITRLVEEKASIAQLNDDEFKAEIHRNRFADAANYYNWKADLLDGMDLETLTFGVANLYCPSGCCRREALEELKFALAGWIWSFNPRPQYLWILGSQQAFKRKTQTKVRIEGLRNTNEKELFRSGWGLEIE